MDDLDRKLLMLIAVNPRIQSRELAESLGISRQCVQERMRILKDKGLFKRITLSISEQYLDAVNVLIFGRSDSVSVDDVLSRLAESDRTLGVLVAGGNCLYVRGLLRDLYELDDYVKFVKRAADLPAPAVGIARHGAGIMPSYVDGVGRLDCHRELTPLDFKILASLRHDARRSFAEISHELGISVRSVKRHFHCLTSEGVIGFYVPWDNPPAEDMFTIIHVTLRDGADNVEVGRRIFSKYPFLTLYVRSFSNLPNFLLCFLCSDKMAEIRKVLGLIAEDEDVLSVTPNLLFRERVYETWRDRLPEVQAALSSGRPRIRNSAHRSRKDGKMSE